MRGGVSKYFRFGTNKKLAQKELERVEQDIDSGKISFVQQETSQVIIGIGKKDMRIEELAVNHLEWVQNNRAPGTFENRQYFIQLFMGFLGPAMVSDITRMNSKNFTLGQSNITAEVRMVVMYYSPISKLCCAGVKKWNWLT